MKKHTTDTFIELSSKKHNNVYLYDKVNYVNNTTKVCITCIKHGDFWMTPANHLFGQGCPKCGIERRSMQRMGNQSDFIKNAIEKHGNKYDYSKVVYNGVDTNVCIICKEHGEFYQTPYRHLRNSIGCPKCSNNVKLSTEEFIKRAKERHGNTYDYSKVVYIDSTKRVRIICPIHGEFLAIPANHLQGCGCPKCVGKNKTTEDFITEAKAIHGNYYDYSKTKYNGALSKTIITCRLHGDFTITPHSHLAGCGCQKCSTSLLEKSCIAYFDKNNIPYEYQKTFDWLRNDSFGKNGNFNMKLDFYFEKYKTAIECQGIQHFEKNQYFDRHGTLQKRKKYDIQKFELCKDNGIRIIYFTNDFLLKYTNLLYIYKNNLFSDIDFVAKMFLL